MQATNSKLRTYKESILGEFGGRVSNDISFGPDAFEGRDIDTGYDGIVFVLWSMVGG